MAAKIDNVTDSIMMKHIVGGRFLTSDDGSVKVPTVMIGQTTRELFEATVKMRSEYRWRDRDYLLSTFPKNGTHFMWEIMMMLLRGSADYIPASKMQCFIDIPSTFSKLDEDFPAERVINTHFRLDVLPKQYRDRKTVLVIRNPKDTVASFYPFFRSNVALLFPEDKKVQDWLANMTFRDFFHIFLYHDENQIYGSYFSYVEYMWNLAKDNPNILIIFYEDLKESPGRKSAPNNKEGPCLVSHGYNKYWYTCPAHSMTVTFREIEKVNTFMGTDRSPELIQEIAEATNFGKMREGKIGTTRSAEQCVQVYRKGEIGDWKNHFTVADNELFDDFLEGCSLSKEIPFRYTPASEP